ncbi:MAG TPA: NTP transferase domain-containing protein [Catenuloplanes sp.]|jgi:molybdopterin-guanine dinucleotide biosynthesis protein A
MGGFGAVVLAGGAARRMGGADKPALPVAGRPMLTRVLAAVADAEPRIVVGPAPAALPAGVRTTRERPPGGGPVAAIAAGLALLDPDVPLVAVLAADLPLLTADAVAVLRQAVAGASNLDGALYHDEDGRPQLLCGVWRVAALRAAVERVAVAGPPAGASPPAPGRGASVRALLDGLAVARVSWQRPGPPPWFDCDTDADLRRAEEWAR